MTREITLAVDVVALDALVGDGRDAPVDVDDEPVTTSTDRRRAFAYGPAGRWLLTFPLAVVEIRGAGRLVEAWLGGDVQAQALTFVWVVPLTIVVAVLVGAVWAQRWRAARPTPVPSSSSWLPAHHPPTDDEPR